MRQPICALLLAISVAAHGSEPPQAQPGADGPLADSRRPTAESILPASRQRTPDSVPKPRARDLGVPLEGTPGARNAITDVAGVEVGHTTLISGDGEHAVRTGVTAVLPRGKSGNDPVFAGWWTLNGNGEMTGTTWVEESGLLEGPVMITNTHSVGVVRDAVIAWQLNRGRGGQAQPWSLPVVAETWDGTLNDINGFHVKPGHVFQALDNAAPGVVAEGNVGGGTGMICHGFKGGIGTASRKLSTDAGGYTLGVLVQCNYGLRRQLRIAGVPVGQEVGDESVGHSVNRSVGRSIASYDSSIAVRGRRTERVTDRPSNRETDQPTDRLTDRQTDRPTDRPDSELGSIIIVVATDAPLLPHQLKRLARRTSLALGRMGSISGNGSGDIFIAFSTANRNAGNTQQVVPVEMLPNDRIGPLFEATVQATEEAIINALVAAETMTGKDGHRVMALPHDRLREVLKKYNRLVQ